MSKPVYLLSIDGGGIRGLLVAKFLAELEKDLKTSLLHTFDYYAGVSTGALIVLGLVARGYSASEVLELYQNRAGECFKPRFLGRFGIGAKYSGPAKRKFLNDLFNPTRFLELPKPVLIISYDFINNNAVVFKSNGGVEGSYNPLVSEVIDSTTAVPSYFPSVLTSSPKPKNLIDGGVAASNPGISLISEVLRQGVSTSQIKMLSLGTGLANIKEVPKKTVDWGKIAWLQNGIIDNFLLGDSSLVDYQAKAILGDNYLRINGELGELSDAFDDLSPSNLLRLEDLAKGWYRLAKDKVLNFLKET